MSRFYILRIDTKTEDPDDMPEDGSEPPLTVPESTMVFYQDRLPEPATNDAEVMARFYADMDGVILDNVDEATLLGCVTDFHVKQVLERWDKICVDMGLQIYNQN